MQSTTAPNDTRLLALEGPLSIYTAADTKPALSAALQGAITLHIDLSAVDEFDCAGLQLLLAARNQALNAQVDLHFINPSPAICELLALSNLAGLFSEQETH